MTSPEILTGLPEEIAGDPNRPAKFCVQVVLRKPLIKRGFTVILDLA
jgi:hypothetical protein